MEESAGKRRARLKAIRDEASLAGNAEDDAAGYPVPTPPDTPGLSLNTNLQDDDPPPLPRFQFYTDPLAAFTGSSQKNKNKKKKLTNYPSGSPGPGPGPGPPPRSNVYYSPTSCFHTPIPTPDYQQGTGRFNPSSTPPGKFTSPDPANHGGNATPSNSSLCTPYGNTGPYGSGLRGPAHSLWSSQPSSTSRPLDGGGHVKNYHRPHRNSCGSDSFLANSPTQWQGRGNGVNSERNQVANQSLGSLNWSPGCGHSGRTPGRSGGRGSQKFHGYGEQSAVINLEGFFSASMLEDPWKDLEPVRMESEEFRVSSCSVAASSSHDWVPKSVMEQTISPKTKSVIFCASGPSLTESLVDSFADAEEGSF